MADIRILTEAELRSQIQLDLDSIEFPELGQVIAQQVGGRQHSDDTTLCDLTGTGIQDTAIANLAYQRCQQHQAGTNFVT